MSSAQLSSPVGRRYAKALHTVIKRSGESTDEWRTMLRDFGDVFNNEKMSRIFKSPLFGKSVQKQAVEEILEAIPTKTKKAQSFFGTLVQSGRIADFEEILQCFEKRLDEEDGSMKVHVTVAAELSSMQSQKLEELAKSTFSSSSSSVNVVMQVDVEEDLLGGFIMEYQNKVLDKSVRSKIKSMFDHVEHG